jgi:protein involved in polysaccharide export with SLBB domain
MSGAGVKVAWGWLSGRAERAAIEAEVREEFAFHMEKLEDELASQGVNGPAASAEVRARFGDVERLVRSATKVKAGGAVMLQKINLVLLVVMIAAVGWMAVQVKLSQQHSLAAIEAVSARLETLGPAVIPGKSDTKTVYIGGAVKEPGAYYMSEGLTLRQLLAKAGGTGDHPSVSIAVVHKGENANGAEVLSATQLAEPAGRDIKLEPGDFITAIAANPLVYMTGKVTRPGPYQLPAGGLSLLRALDSAGLGEGVKRVVISRLLPLGGERQTKFDLEELKSRAIPDVLLEGNDRIVVE